jgi:hypothetical protein
MAGIRLCCLATALVGANLCAQVPPSAREQALGRVMASEIERRERVVDDPQVVAYITGVALKLARTCGAGDVTVRVIQSDAVNATVVPGGFLFVNTGLLRAAESEAELAGVLAHLMTRQALLSDRGRNAQVAVSGPNGYAFAPLYDDLAPRGLEGAAQAAVSAADQRAMQCMDHAGYDPVGLIELLRRLPAMPVERMERVAEAIMDLEPSSAFLVHTREFFEVRQHIAASGKAPSLRN